MTRLLDTDTCIELLRGNRAVVSAAKNYSPQSVAVSVITRYELLYGVLSCAPERREVERAKVLRLLETIRELPFTTSTADIAANIRRSLSAKREMIGPLDILIAATSLEEQCELITHNLREFRRIDELKCSSWNEK
ncbi:MAG: type II toxin-antitoxin system VapC family toxin [Opitutales bacterium]